MKAILKVVFVLILISMALKWSAFIFSKMIGLALVVGVIFLIYKWITRNQHSTE